MRDGVLVEVLAVVSPIAAMLFGYLAFRRGRKSDDGQAAREMGALLTEVGYIKAQLDGINKRMEQDGSRYVELLERVTMVEGSAKQAHKRIDSLERRRSDET
jgi:hypothetical protein